jgi:hypothetical protein
LSTIYAKSTEPYLQYGLDHFRKKYGLILASDARSADIVIGSSPSAVNEAGLQIILNSDDKEGIGYLHLSGKVIPFFRQPAETTGPGSLASAVFGNRGYPCVSMTDRRITFGFDVFTEIGRILDGARDSFFLRKDAVGATLRALPVVDILEDFVAAAIQRVSPDRNLLKPFQWPEGRNFGLIVTHDVDRVSKTYQYLPSIFKSLKKADLSGLAYHLKNLLLKHGTQDPYWTFDFLSRMEETQGVKSTYYFLNETGRLNPLNFQSWILYYGRYRVKKDSIKNNIRQLNLRGHEIGVHGSFNSYRTSDLLRTEKELLESITGSPIAGIRQHHLNYDKASTPQIHNACGFKYDTSIGFKPADGTGFRRGTSFPFHVMLPDRTISPLLEIPLIIMDVALDSSATPSECLKLVDQVARYRGILTILWHSNSLNQREFPLLFSTYQQILKEAKTRGAWIARASDVSDWMQPKEAVSERPEY